MRIIVCGSRNYDNKEVLEDSLKYLHQMHNITHLWHGNANGADKMAGEWAKKYPEIKVHPTRAEWSRYGRGAGPIRNKAMLGNGIELVIAFPGGIGTSNMIKQAEKASIEVLKMPN